MAQLADFHRDYWTAFRDVAMAESDVTPQGNPSHSYMIFRLGVGGAHLAASVLFSRNLVTFYLLLEGPHRDETFAYLYARKSGIEAELGEAAVWTVSTNSNRARVTVELDVLDFDNRKDWPRQHSWLIQKARRFDKVFRRHLHDLKGSQ